jgi:hypothetical protein
MRSACAGRLSGVRSPGLLLSETPEAALEAWALSGVPQDEATASEVPGKPMMDESYNQSRHMRQLNGEQGVPRANTRVQDDQHQRGLQNISAWDRSRSKRSEE